MTAPRVSLVLLIAGLAACGGTPEPGPPPVPPRVESAGLGIAIAALPEGWTVRERSPERLIFTRGGGSLVISLGDEEPAGVNLVAGVERRQRVIEAAGGRFAGSKELVTPWGPAFTARGRLPEAAGEVEELTVLALHPGGWPRPLIAAYRYPLEEGVTARRSRELLDLLAELEVSRAGETADPR